MVRVRALSNGQLPLLIAHGLYTGDIAFFSNTSYFSVRGILPIVGSENESIFSNKRVYVGLTNGRIQGDCRNETVGRRYLC